MSNTVYVKIKNNSSYPYRVKDTIIEAILSIYDKETDKYVFIDSLEGADDEYHIRISFADGGGQCMPISNFNNIFTIVPKGALTGVLYE